MASSIDASWFIQYPYLLHAQEFFSLDNNGVPPVQKGDALVLFTRDAFSNDDPWAIMCDILAVSNDMVMGHAGAFFRQAYRTRELRIERLRTGPNRLWGDISIYTNEMALNFITGNLDGVANPHQNKTRHYVPLFREIIMSNGEMLDAIIDRYASSPYFEI